MTRESSGAPVGLPRYLRDSSVAVSQPTDASEREADHLADHVMSPAPCPACAAAGAPCGGCGGGVARSADGPAPRTAAAPALGGGQALDGAARGFFEPRFGRDLGGVRVHASEDDAALARSYGARAFTTGRDIVFGRGQYVPGSEAGRRLLAHELAHVVEPPPEGTVARQPADAGVDAPATTTAPPIPAPATAPGAMFDAAYGACPTLAEGVRRDAFALRSFHLDRYIPSTTFGMFDASYLPLLSIMPVTVKIKFDFVNADNTPGFWDLVRRASAGQDVRRFFWSDTDKDDFKREYISRVTSRWSAQHSMVSARPCWGFTAVPLISPVEVDDADDAHYVATVHKSSGPGIDYGSSTNDPNLAHPDRPATATLYQSDVREESNFQSVAVATSERQRLESVLAGSGASPVLFAKDSDEISVLGRLALIVFALGLKTKNPSDPLIPIHLDGFASSEGDPAHNVDLANRRVAAVRDFLFRLGVAQPMGVTGHGPVGAPNDPSNRKVDITIDHAFETTYASNRYSVGEHEFGHMLGLPDEYQNNTTGILGAQQTLYMGLVTAAGVQGPAVWGTRTASQMADGVDVLPRHYVTLWEALAKMTAPDLTQTDWTLR